MDQVFTVPHRQTHGKQTHWVFRPGRYHPRQLHAFFQVAFTDIGRRRPGRVRDFLADRGHLQRRVHPRLADTDRINNHFVFAFRVVVQTQFGQVDHDPLTFGIRQQHLGRDS
ncbi:hypothetical protein D3C78_1297630 [compost metagenome]